MRARLAVVGHPVGHSISPHIHQAALVELDLDCGYEALDVSPSGLAALFAEMRRGGWLGLNLTHPHKLPAVALLDDPGDGRRIGAVNTVVVRGRRLLGRNTDGPGFLRSIGLDGSRGFEDHLAVGQQSSSGKGPALSMPARAVLLGAGGAARAIGVALSEGGVQVSIIARRKDAAASVLDRCPGHGPGSWAPWEDHPRTGDLLARADLLVNCTTLGLGARRGDPCWQAAQSAFHALPLHQLPLRSRVVDINYWPIETPLLAWAQERGSPGQGGLGMLVAQAALSFELWTGRPAPLETMRRAALHALGSRG